MSYSRSKYLIWYQKNRKKITARYRRRWREDPQFRKRCLENNARWMVKAREHRLEYRRHWRLTNAARLKKKNRARRETPEYRQWAADYYQKNKKKILQQQRERRKNRPS